MNAQDDLELKRSLEGLPRSIEPPEDLWPSVRARLVPRRARWLRPAALRIAAGLALLAVAAGWLLVETRSASTWRIAGLAPGASGRVFAPGEALATGAGERVSVAVGTIGRVDVAPNTRVRLLDARRTRQRLALDAGAIEARISAPPRLFIVETPSGRVVDLGCAYRLEVDSAGDGFVRVTLGWISSERDGRESLVPEGFRLAMTRTRGIGTPVAEDAPAALAAAVRRFDGGDSAAADAALAAARPRDAVTLWHLLARTDGALRDRVYDRLAALAPPPAEVSREAALRLDARALRLWWVRLPATLPIYPSWRTTLWTWWLRLFG